MTVVRRVLVVGSSGSGKTTTARRIASELGVPHIELDAVHWGPDWTAATAGEMQERVREAIRPGAWVVDGNYRSKIGTLCGTARTPSSGSARPALSPRGVP